MLPRVHWSSIEEILLDFSFGKNLLIWANEILKVLQLTVAVTGILRKLKAKKLIVYTTSPEEGGRRKVRKLSRTCCNRLPSSGDLKLSFGLEKVDLWGR